MDGYQSPIYSKLDKPFRLTLCCFLSLVKGPNATQWHIIRVFLMCLMLLYEMDNHGILEKSRLRQGRNRASLLAKPLTVDKSYRPFLRSQRMKINVSKILNRKMIVFKQEFVVDHFDCHWYYG